MANLLRPCERQNIPNFVLLQNSKHDLVRIIRKYKIYFVKIVFLDTQNYSKIYVFDIWCQFLTIKRTFFILKRTFWPQNWGQRSKTDVFVSFVFRKTKYGNYCVIIKLLFSQKFRSDSNFNRKFDYEFGTHGLQIYT